MLAACFLLGSLFPIPMPEPAIPSLPFFTRDMLRFGQTAKLELRVDMQADEAAPLAISGITREGHFTHRVTTPSNSLNTSATFGITDIPIMISVRDVGANFEQGQAYVTLSLVVNGDVVQVLTSGYVYNQKALSWPQTQQVDLRPGGGRIQRKTPTAVAAGNELTITVPAGEVWRIRDITFLITTSATVANRRAIIYISTPTDQTLRMWSDTDQTASLTRVYHGGNLGMGSAGATGIHIFIPIPSDMLLFAGDILTIGANSLQATDQITTDEITIEKYFQTI